VVERRPRFALDPEHQRLLTTQFLRAADEGDMPALIETLAEDVVVYSDGGGKVNAARKPVVGRQKVALFLTKLRRLAPQRTTFRVEVINGQPGIVTLVDGAVVNVITFDFAESGIRNIYIVVNPDKLHRFASSIAADVRVTDSSLPAHRS
jgi:RNA polymerase sigma-70 factor (ECF subfamily)